MKIIKTNKEFLRLTGFSKNEVVDKNFDLFEVSEKEYIRKENSDKGDIYIYNILLLI